MWRHDVICKSSHDDPIRMKRGAANVRCDCVIMPEYSLILLKWPKYDENNSIFRCICMQRVLQLYKSWRRRNCKIIKHFGDLRRCIQHFTSLSLVTSNSGCICSKNPVNWSLQNTTSILLATYKQKISFAQINCKVNSYCYIRNHISTNFKQLQTIWENVWQLENIMTLLFSLIVR